MSKFRKAALAGATAVAIAFGSTSIAVAQEGVPAIGGQGRETAGEGGSSTAIGRAIGAYDENGLNGVDGRALFGSSNSEDVPSFGEQPAWAKFLSAGSVILAISAFVGLVVGPAYNFVVHGPF